MMYDGNRYEIECKYSQVRCFWVSASAFIVQPQNACHDALQTVVEWHSILSQAAVVVPALM
jgi:hypothetical protein